MNLSIVHLFLIYSRLDLKWLTTARNKRKMSNEIREKISVNNFKSTANGYTDT